MLYTADQRQLLGPSHRRLPLRAARSTPRATHIDGFENEGVVWKNGRELYDLSDGSGEGSMPYAIAVYGDDVFSAGTLFGTSRTAAVWHGEKILHTLTDGTGHGEVYSMFVVPLYD